MENRRIRNALAGLVLASASLLGGCQTQKSIEQRVSNEVYQVSNSFLEVDPQDLTKIEQPNSTLYSEAPIFIPAYLIFGEPKHFLGTIGKEVEVYKDGSINISYLPASSEKNWINSFYSLGLDKKDNKITIFRKPRVVEYTKQNDEWTKRVYDIKSLNIKENQAEGSPRLISETQVTNEEVQRYLDALERIRKKFQN